MQAKAIKQRALVRTPYLMIAQSDSCFYRVPCVADVAHEEGAAVDLEAVVGQATSRNRQ